MQSSKIQTEIESEVIRLHVFFESWFQGTLPPSDLEDVLGAALHPKFENIQPAGKVMTRAHLMEALSGAHGSNPNFRIEITEARILEKWPGAGLILAGYVEAQFGAINTCPSDNLRRSTVLFERAGPRLIWRYLQETALPA